jgi:Putative auto-transporter adhesin, head GIN domain
MKTYTKFLIVILAAMLAIGCNISNVGNLNVITPSNVIISENREVRDFSAIDFTTVGKVNIMQGDTESLNISGPDNIVPRIKTSVNNGTLIIETEGNLNIAPLGKQNPLVFTIVVKNLNSLDVSGLGDVQIETLSTPNLTIDMSGAGKIAQNQIITDDMVIDLSGLGGIDITGQATQATVDISGAGSVNAPDLKIQNANVNISGLGSATLWVTDELSGEISGGGSVSYYGNPQANTSSTGLGSFKSLGDK